MKNCVICIFIMQGPLTGSAPTIDSKAVRVSKFTVNVEVNGVGEGDKSFFEGIVDAQPQPGKMNCAIHKIKVTYQLIKYITVPKGVF